MTAYELTFKQPTTELHPYYKQIIRFFRKHEWALLDFEALLDPTFNNDHQLEAFRCAVREVSNETGRNVILDDKTKAPDILLELAPPGHPGSLPEIWSEKDQAVADALNNPEGEKAKRFLI